MQRLTVPRLARLAAPLLTGLLLTTSCQAVGPAQDDVEVAAAFYPLAFVASQVAGGNAAVTNLTTPGREPHDLEPSIGQVGQIAQADLVVLLSGFQPPVDAAAAQYAEGTVLDVGKVVSLHPLAADASGASQEQTDPHFWLDPLLMADLGDSVAAELSDLDPDKASTYRTNSSHLRSDLEAIDQEFAAGLSHCARQTVVVSHDAFSYLGRYGLDIVSIAGLSPENEPTAGDLARLRDEIASTGVTTVFSEVLASDALARTLADEAGVTTAVLDPIEGLSDTTADQDYFTLMRANLAALRKANQC